MDHVRGMDGCRITLCNDGYMPTWDSSACVGCPEGWIPNGPKCDAPACPVGLVRGPDGVACIPCPLGWMAAGDICEACAPGTGGCTDWAAGTYASAGASSACRCVLPMLVEAP